MRFSVLVAAVFSVPAISETAGAQQKRVEYDISFPNAAEHEARVVATFFGIPRGTVLHARMSRSSPGRYAPTSFSKSVYDVSAADGHGKALMVSRPDEHEWDVKGHDGTVRIGYTVWGDRIDGTNLSVDHTHAHLNMPATFMWAPETEMAPIRLSVHAPRGWSVATQLVPTADSAQFTAPNMQWFMDSPTEIGPVTWRTWTASYGGKTSTFRLATHTLSIAAQVDTFAAMARAVVAEEIAMWGEPAGYDFGTYTFLGDYLPWAGGDGMEHRNSTFLTSSRGLDTHANRMGNLSSLAHEFFHSWNMERLRSKQIEPFDFSRANMSDALWFGEGFTNYYGALLMRRSGFYTDSAFLAQFGGEIGATIEHGRVEVDDCDMSLRRGRKDRRAPHELDRHEALVEKDRGERHPDQRLEQHQDPGPRPTNRPDADQEEGRRDAGRHDPGDRRQRERSGTAQDRRQVAAGRHGETRARNGCHDEDPARRLLGGDGRKAAPADRHEHGLAGGGEEPECDPQRMDHDPGRRVQAAGDHEDHPDEGETQRDQPRPVEPLMAKRDRDHGDQRGVRVEREQDEGDRGEVERGEHRDVEAEPGKRDDREAHGIAAWQAERVDEPDAAGQAPENDCDDDEQPERRPPGDE